MKKTYIYMNDAIRERNTKRKVIVVQRGRQLRTTNTVRIFDANGALVGRVKFRNSGLKHSPYNVRAWVELYEKAKAKRS